MKTEPMSQQVTALERMDGCRWYALFMEQGTGKTWSLLADAARYWERGKIDSLFVLAPNGVHTNWVRREIPKHLAAPHTAVAWRSGAGKREMANIRSVLRPDERRLRILTMNYEALNGNQAQDFAAEFLESGASMFDLDESQKIKNAQAGISRKVMDLRPLAQAVRISTGTPMDKPPDIFQQFEFMKSGLLGTDSYRAFMSEYAVLADWKNPQNSDDWAFARQVDANPRMRYGVRVARDDITGQPMYRNLDRLRELVAAHAYRVLKRDCLDLPEKIYQSVYFDMTPAQWAAYRLMEEEMRIRLEDGSFTPVSALAALQKLQQITSGYVMVPGREEPMYVDDDNPRIRCISDYVRDNVNGKVIIWAKYREEVAAIVRGMKTLGRNVVEYHGGVSDRAKEAAIDSLQEGDADTFVAIQRAGKEGLTLTAAETSIYCSNEFSSLARVQSEDRNHRKGTINHIVYVDAVATGTVDEAIVRAHQSKMELSATILGDTGLDLRRFL